ncbi:unnamed protein product, partial [Allacma fusca]
TSEAPVEAPVEAAPARRQFKDNQSRRRNPTRRLQAAQPQQQPQQQQQPEAPVEEPVAPVQVAPVQAEEPTRLP